MIPNFEDIGLLIIDVQDRLLSAMPPEIAERTVRNIDILTELVSDVGGFLVYTEQYPRGLGSTAALLKPRLVNAPRIEKITFSCLQEPRFIQEILPNLPSDLIVVGMETHICVLQTLIDLTLEDEEDERVIFVPNDAVCSRSKANWRNGLDQMYDLSAVMTNTETLVFQALGASNHERFKHYSSRIK